MLWENPPGAAVEPRERGGGSPVRSPRAEPPHGRARPRHAHPTVPLLPHCHRSHSHQHVPRAGFPRPQHHTDTAAAGPRAVPGMCTTGRGEAPQAPSSSSTLMPRSRLFGLGVGGLSSPPPGFALLIQRPGKMVWELTWRRARASASRRHPAGKSQAGGWRRTGPRSGPAWLPPGPIPSPVSPPQAGTGGGFTARRPLP